MQAERRHARLWGAVHPRGGQRGVRADRRGGETKRAWRHWARDERARVVGGARDRHGGAVVIVQ